MTAFKFAIPVISLQSASDYAVFLDSIQYTCKSASGRMIPVAPLRALYVSGNLRSIFSISRSPYSYGMTFCQHRQQQARR